MNIQSTRAYLWAHFNDQTEMFIGIKCTSDSYPSAFCDTMILIASLDLTASSEEKIPPHTIIYGNVAKLLNTMYVNGDFDKLTISYKNKLFKISKLRLDKRRQELLQTDTQESQQENFQ